MVEGYPGSGLIPAVHGLGDFEPLYLKKSSTAVNPIPTSESTVVKDSSGIHPPGSLESSSFTSGGFTLSVSLARASFALLLYISQFPTGRNFFRIFLLRCLLGSRFGCRCYLFNFVCHVVYFDDKSSFKCLMKCPHKTYQGDLRSVEFSAQGLLSCVDSCVEFCWQEPLKTHPSPAQVFSQLCSRHAQGLLSSVLALSSTVLELCWVQCSVVLTVVLIPVLHLYRTTRGGGGGTRVYFGWVCAARVSKFGPRFRKNLHSKW